MEKRLSLLKPVLGAVTLQNETNERVEFLQIPICNGIGALEKDVKLGATQFKELDKLLNKKKEPQYILITTDNLELGYMAVTYLASGFEQIKSNIEWGSNETDFPLEIGYDDMEYEKWEESKYKIPIIREEQLNQELWNYSEGVPMGPFYAQENRSYFRHMPYWRNCQNESVCLVYNGMCGYSCGFGMPTNNQLHRGLSLFEKNDKIYIINLESGNIFDWEIDDDDLYDERSKWNYEILSYSMDEVEIKLEEKCKQKYYSMVFQGMVERLGLELTKNFSVKKIMNQLMPMKETDKCKLIGEILQYAMKDWDEEHEMILSEEDFLFLKRFVKGESGDTIRKKSSQSMNSKDKMMHQLIGMDSVKEQVLNVVNVMKFNKMRSKMKIKGSSYHNVHMMLGAPGTAKTTIAQLMGQIMVEEKLLPDDRFVCVNGAELKGMYVGHSAPKTKALFDENDIIVIDEAYSIVSDSGQDDSFSKEAIAQLIIELEKHSADKLVIFAGYGGPKVREKDNKMKAFLDANPGIKSRITSTIYFDSYSADEMVEIFFHVAKNQNFQVDEKARPAVFSYFSERIHATDFGNGREARSLLETTIIFAAKRLFEQKKVKFTKQEMQTLTTEDVRNAIAQMRQANGVQEGAQKSRIGFA